VIAVDTNILVYAHRRESPWHDVAARAVLDLAESGRPWALPWPCVGEFLSVSTNARLFERPSLVEEAVQQVDHWAESPSMHWLGESPSTWPVLADLLRTASVGGARVHDARIAAICLAHGVRELWTADRDYGRFPILRIRNPLIG
jgi:toxin-antitoxin system PIN domain toxin